MCMHQSARNHIDHKWNCTLTNKHSITFHVKLANLPVARDLSRPPVCQVIDTVYSRDLYLCMPLLHLAACSIIPVHHAHIFLSMNVLTKNPSSVLHVFHHSLCRPVLRQ